MPSQFSEEQLLEGVDIYQVAHLTRAFDIMAQKMNGVSNSTALWALASLLAKIMASCSMDPAMMDATGKRFSEMLKAAYPAMVKAIEEAERMETGRPQYDA
jgi:hypothetical protein